MHGFFTVLSLFTLCAAVMPAQAEDAQTILQKVEELHLKRLEGIAGYTVDATTMGQRQVALYERTPVTIDGETVEVFRRVPASEIRQRSGGQGRTMTPEQLEAFADAQEMTGNTLSNEMERGMTQAGLPKGLLGALGAGSADEPWASPDPRIMMGANAGFLRAAANADRANAAEARSPETDKGFGEFAGRAKLVDTGKVDGVEAFHLVADDLDHRQILEDGGEMVIDTVSLWIDRGMYVPLKLTMRGTMSMQGQTRKIQIEKINSDFREVENSSMYEPYRQVMRIGGVMTEKQKKEMQKAQSELAGLEKQIAAMPQSQREMMEKMMGSQLDAIRNMAAGGDMEVVTEVNRILVDTGFADRN